MFTVGILTISDKGSLGERADSSSEAVRDVVSQLNARVVDYAVVPDEKRLISERLIEWTDGDEIDLVITTGGTGLSPRDVTPEATIEVLDKLAPGFAEAMRAESLRKTPHAMLSRGVAGVRNRTLIVNVPGSPKAARECLQVILPALPHAVETARGESEDCAAVEKGRQAK
jgi:molybdenum cofactor synthesis domain-containing protein